jgi:glycosyltransferase involved in cell wall biosynthesis
MTPCAKISVAVIAFNEADRLAECLRSVHWADDIVVVDSGSTDETPAIARSMGCRVYHQPFAGFGRQKQSAVDRCRNAWVLILDADERMPADSAEQLPAAIASAGDDVAAFSFRRKNYLHGRWIRRCGWWPDTVVRLVCKERGRFSGDSVHERWLADGRVAALSDAIEHHSFRDYADMIAKLQHYSTLGARQLAERGATVRWWQPTTHGLWTFFQVFVLKFGFLCGLDGFIISLLNAGGSFMKYAKCWEIAHYGRG